MSSINEYINKLNTMLIKKNKEIIKEALEEVDIDKNKEMSEEMFKKKSGVSVITCTCHMGTMDAVFNNFLRQSYENKELIIILNNNDMDISQYREKADHYENIKVLQLDESYTLGDCFELGIQNSNLEYIAKFDDDDYYGSDYLNQAMDTFYNLDCDIVGKAAFYIYFVNSKTLALIGSNKENRFISHVADATLVFRRKVLETIDIPCTKEAGAFVKIQRQCRNNNFKIYSTDKFNYLSYRNPSPEQQHTWKVSDSEYLGYKTVKIIEENTDDFMPYIEP